MYNIKRVENLDDCQIERSEQALSYDVVKYQNEDPPITKVSYRKPDGSIKRYWIDSGAVKEQKEDNTVDAIYIMNDEGKTIDRY